MYIYHLTQHVVHGYDTYSDCVVCAENKAEAVLIHPSPYGKMNKPDGYNDEWPNDSHLVQCEEIGQANEHMKKGVICASFHAG